MRSGGHAERGMAITEYVVVCLSVLGVVAALVGVPVHEGKPLLALLTDAMGTFLSALTIAISFP